MHTQLIPYSDISRMAQDVADSRLFPGITQQKQAIGLMLLCQAEGLHPAIAARDYHIIEGRPTLKTDAMLTRFQAAGGKVAWIELSDEVASAQFSHPAGGCVKITWTLEMAKRARLSTRKQKDGGPNMWEKFPRQMLRSRTVSEGIRAIYPGVAVGIYTPGEAFDMEAEVVASPEPKSQHEIEEPVDIFALPEEAESKPQTEPVYHPLNDLFLTRDVDQIERFLIHLGKIKSGQSYMDLPPKFIESIQKHAERFFESVKNHAENNN